MGIQRKNQWKRKNIQVKTERGKTKEKNKKNVRTKEKEKRGLTQSKPDSKPLQNIYKTINAIKTEPLENVTFIVNHDIIACQQ